MNSTAHSIHDTESTSDESVAAKTENYRRDTLFLEKSAPSSFFDDSIAFPLSSPKARKLSAALLFGMLPVKGAFAAESFLERIGREISEGTPAAFIVISSAILIIVLLGAFFSTQTSARKKTAKKPEKLWVFTRLSSQDAASPVVYKDDEGRYVECNEAYCQLIGFSENEIVGKTAYDLWPEDIAHDFQKRDENFIASLRSDAADSLQQHIDGRESPSNERMTSRSLSDGQ